MDTTPKYRQQRQKTGKGNDSNLRTLLKWKKADRVTRQSKEWEEILANSLGNKSCNLYNLLKSLQIIDNNGNNEINLITKWATDLNGYLSEEDMQMARR